MQISSFQMEKLRKIERNHLRKATGLYKNKRANKYINSQKLYETAKIDRKLTTNNTKFIEKNQGKKPE